MTQRGPEWLFFFLFFLCQIHMKKKKVHLAELECVEKLKQYRACSENVAPATSYLSGEHLAFLFEGLSVCCSESSPKT